MNANGMSSICEDLGDSDDMEVSLRNEIRWRVLLLMES
jgi:hypothetical protein